MHEALEQAFAHRQPGPRSTVFNRNLPRPKFYAHVTLGSMLKRVAEQVPDRNTDKFGLGFDPYLAVLLEVPGNRLPV